jgi:hypothetical protein
MGSLARRAGGACIDSIVAPGDGLTNTESKSKNESSLEIVVESHGERMSERR